MDGLSDACVCDAVILILGRCSQRQEVQFLRTPPSAKEKVGGRAVGPQAF